jgi:hypothetical protein
MARKRINLRPNCRALYSKHFYKGDFEWFGIPGYPEFLPADDDVLVEVKLTTSLDNLSQEYYDTPELWFVIALANNIDLPPLEMFPGQVLRIPTKTRVTSILKQAKGKQ